MNNTGLCITIAANIGDVAILGFDACFPDSVLGFLPFSNKINIEYIYFMLVAYKNRMNNKASKVAQSNLSLNKINSMYFPFPPLEEQERIVERVNAIMAQIDEYEKIEQELVQLKVDFPGDMRAAILQAAMQGKLTKQLESDNSVEEMIKQKICNSNSFIPVDEEEHPFDIPTNWQWVRLGNFVSFVGGTSYKRTDTTDKGVRILRGGNIQESKILYYEDDVFLPNKFKDEGKTIKNGDILIVASTGSKTVIGKPGFVYFDDKDTQIGAFLRIIRIKEEFTDMLPYIRVIFRSEFYRNHIRDNVHGVNINNVRSEHITKFAIPIPPIEEQQRIVERLDELLPICENLM